MESSIWPPCSKEREGREERTEARKEVRHWAKVPIGGARGSAEVDSGYWTDRNLVGGGEEHGIKQDSAAGRWRGPVLANAILGPEATSNRSQKTCRPGFWTHAVPAALGMCF